MIVDASVWTAADFRVARQWARPFTATMLAEIDAALKRALDAGKRFHEVTRERDFPLPLTAPLLAQALASLEDGPGFAVLSGFPVERYSYDENVMAYAGLSTHLGRIVDQSYAGAMKVDVVDLGLAYGKDVRGYNTAAALRFHSDGAHLTGLMCLGEAAEGGLSVLASASAVHNAILAERPDLHAVLARGFHHHRRGEHAPGEPPVSERIPVFGRANGQLQCTYDRFQSLWSADAGIAIAPEEVAAMDYMDAVLARPDLQLHMNLRLGDLQYVHNFTVLHARSEYRDGPGKRRHLVRLWLDRPEGKRPGATMRDLYVRHDAR